MSPEQLIADIADGFYVTDLIGVGTNMITGDYSRGASGFWIENGKRVYPVSEVTIAGHLTDIFRTLTPANDLSFRYGINAPTLGGGQPLPASDLLTLFEPLATVVRAAGDLAQRDCARAIQALRRGGPTTRR